MPLKKFDMDPANIDADGVAEAQKPNGAVALNGAQADAGTAAQWDVGDAFSDGVGGARMGISLASSGVTTTFTGKNQDGVAITEAVVGPSVAALAETTQYFSQITGISTSAAPKANFTIGAVDEVVTKTYPLNWRSHEPPVYALHAPAGTFSATIEEYFDDPQNQPLSTDGWITRSAAETGNIATDGVQHARAVRLKTVSYSDGAEFQFIINQN